MSLNKSVSVVRVEYTALATYHMYDVVDSQYAEEANGNVDTLASAVFYSIVCE